MKRYVVWALSGLCTIFIDQFVKLYLSSRGEIDAINKGIGFGLFGGDGVTGLVLNLLGIFLAGYLFVAFEGTDLGKRKNIYLLFLSLIIGAGVSNFIDRIFRGGAVDYINFWIIPSFNLADLTITLSVAGVVILTLYESLNGRNKKRV